MRPRLTAVLLAAALLLAGCGIESQSEKSIARPVPLPGGGSVLCVFWDGDATGGLDCDWMHADRM